MDAGELSGIYSFFRDSTEQGDVGSPVLQQDDEEKVESDEALFCRSCLNQITRKDQAVTYKRILYSYLF